MALYERERDVVMTFVARRTLDVPLAADITAEVFALAVCAWERLRGRAPEEARAWLFTVARRQLSRYFKRARVEQRAVVRLGIRVPAIHEEDIAAIETRAGLAELRELLAGELARLSAEQRDALRLRVIDDRPYDEVARELGITEQAARARVSRGLKLLGRSLEPHREMLEASL